MSAASRARRAGRRSRTCSGLALLVLPAILGARWLHTELKESDPAEDAVLTESPTAITLTYTTDVQLTLSTVEVRPAAPDAQPVPAGKPAYLADDRRDVLVLPLTEAMGSGRYAVAWTTAGPDGHGISGDFEFVVELSPPAGSPAAPDTGVADADPATPPAPGAQPLPDGPGPTDPSRRETRGAEAVSALLQTGLSFLFYSCIVGILGAVVFRLLVLRRCAGDGESAEVIDSAVRRSGTVVAVSLVLLLFLLPLRLWSQAEAFFPNDVAGNLLTVATGTPWAAGWWLLVAGCAVVAGGLLISGRERLRPFGWKVIAVGALLLPAAPLLSGHGWSDSPRVVAAAATYLHVAAAGGWMGGLACLLLAGLPALRRHGHGAGTDAPGVAGMVSAFSRVAQVAVAVLLVTGALKVWVHIDAASQLWTTPWGRSLLVKDVIVACVLALGFYNWRFVRPRLGRGSHGKALTRSATVELVLGAAAVAATSFLVSQPLG